MRIDYLYTHKMLIWGEKAYLGSSLNQKSMDIDNAMCE